jgi:probable rRNA maturation factor
MPKAKSSSRRVRPKGRVSVEWTDAGVVPVPKPTRLAALATRVLREEGLDGKVNLVFCENSLIRKLNRQFRKLDKVTDVLSFHYGEEDEEPDAVRGEIYIATTQALKQAPRWKNPFFDELRRLVVHGALHLAGYDHMKAKERLTMRAREDHYLTHGN